MESLLAKYVEHRLRHAEELDPAELCGDDEAALVEPLRALIGEYESIAIATLDRRGDRIASADAVGVVRVGPVDGGEPHLLLGHEGFLWGAHFTPDDRHLVSVDDGGTVRVWEVPEGRPFHTLPHDELLDRLRGLTNLRVVRSDEGYRLEAEPFRGWAEVPTW